MTIEAPDETATPSEAAWQAARLAALVAAAARLGHDLRGVLSPALLVAERLQQNPDPMVQRAGSTMVRAVDRATNLVRSLVDYARETPLALQRGPVALRAAVAQAAAGGPAVENAVPEALQVEADCSSLVCALGHLLRNAGEAGARHVRLTAAREEGAVALLVADDGPGLPGAVQAALFRPSGNGGHAGLGLATARDLVRANGGELALAETGPAGTSFRLTLPPARPGGA